jgi:hypothetical protein
VVQQGSAVERIGLRLEQGDMAGTCTPVRVKLIRLASLTRRAM